MNLRELQVVHRHEALASTPAPLAEASGRGEALVVHTCQRLLFICADRPTRERLLTALGGDPRNTVLEGSAAYAFLLRLACGLESRLVGETEVFAQIKQAWAEFTTRNPPLARELDPFMQSLFRDVKDVRSRFLSNLGSASYGSLVRRVLQGAGVAGPTLLLGAGQLGEAVAPWIRSGELWLWNRDQMKSARLADALLERDARAPVRVIDSDATSELSAWRRAANVVVCIPPDPGRDAARAAAWAEPREPRGELIHLGAEDGFDRAVWAPAGEMTVLGDLYESLQAHSDLRQAQLRRAVRACTERSLLRALGRSDSEPHGWEDLLAIDTLSS